MDFMSEGLFDGYPIRILTVVDIRTREELSTRPRADFQAVEMIEVLDQLVRGRSSSGAF